VTRRAIITIAVLAPTVLLSARSSTAQDSLKIGTVVLTPGAPGQEIPIYLQNTASLSSVRVPLEIRAFSTYPTSLALGYGDRLPLPGPLDATLIWDHFGDTPMGCYPSMVLASGAAPVSLTGLRWGFMLWREDLNPTNMLGPGTDSDGSMKLIVDIPPGIGTFTIDTACIAPSTSIQFIDDLGMNRDVSFVKGNVTVDNRPVIVPIPPQFVNEGDLLEITVSATDADGTFPVLSVLAPDIPPNASFIDLGSGNGTFSFAPDYSQAGVYNVRFFASDGLLPDTEVVMITVVDAAPPGSADSIIVGSKRVAAGQTDSVFVRLVNRTLTVQRMTVPLRIDAGTTGSFITELAIQYRERLGVAGVMDESVATARYASVEPGVSCYGEIGFGGAFASNDTSMHPVVSSPEGVLYKRDAGLAAGPLAPEADVGGSMMLRFAANDSAGTFTIDRTCIGVGPTDTVGLFDGTAEYGVSFVPGVITINSPPVAHDTCVSVIVDETQQMELPATDADDDPLSYAITGGPIVGDTNFFSAADGSFEYIAPLLPGTDTIYFVVDDGYNSSDTGYVCFEILSALPDTFWVDSATGDDFDNDGSEEFPLKTISKAMGLPIPNLVVIVGPGTYPERVLYPQNQKVRLVSEEGPFATRIVGDGSGDGSAVVLNAGNVDDVQELIGFTVAANVVTDSDCDGCAGGITVREPTRGNVINCVITRNAGLNAAGGIEYQGGAPGVIAGNWIVDNEADNVAGAVALYATANVTFLNNTVAYNSTTGKDHAGLFVSGVTLIDTSSILFFQNNIIAFNAPGYGLYALAESEPFPEILRNCVYFGNGSGNAVPPNFTSLSDWKFTDPLFLGAAAGDYHLTCPSPARNAGYPFIPPGGGFDLDGQSRPNEGAIDIGGDEFYDDHKVARFSPSDTSGCVPLAVTFVNSSECLDEQFAWTFGDGGNSTLKNPTHSFVNPGDYTVRLIASGDLDADTAFGTIYVAAPITGDYTMSAPDGCAPHAVTFGFTAGAEVDSIHWSFGDGGSSTQPAPTHIYNTPGVYGVRLTLVNACDTITITKADSIRVGMRPDVAIVSSYDTAVPPVCNPHTVDFDYISDRPIVAWSWDFGDNTTSSDSTPSHTYAEGDTFSVRLIVQGECGADTAIRQNYIKLVPRPTALPRTDTLFGCAGVDTIALIGNITGAVSTSRWLFGDGDSANGSNASHLYAEVGRYLPKLIITHVCGTDTVPIPDSLTIGSIPQAVFDLSADSLYEPELVQFTDQSGNNPTQWSWQFGDGAVSALPSPAHAYAPGVYAAGMWVSNPCGADTSSERTIRVGGFRAAILDSLGASDDTVRYSFETDTLILPYDHPLYFSAGLTPVPSRGSVSFQFSSQGDVPPTADGILTVAPTSDVPSGTYEITLWAVDSLRNIIKAAVRPWNRVARSLIEIAPVPLDFGRLLVNSSIMRTLTVVNEAAVGSEILVRLEKPTLVGSMYTMNADSVTLAPQAFVNWIVSFRPTTTGNLPGSVRIRSNDPAAPDTTIMLTGRGVSELIPPLVTATIPGADQEHLVNGTLRVEFDENMVFGGLDTAVLVSSRKAGQISGTTITTARTLTFVPGAWFPPDDTVTLTVRAVITDNNGNRLDGDGDRIEEGSPADDFVLRFFTGPAVYPGDANHDGRVDEADVLPLGRYWRLLGPSRPAASNAFFLQPAFSWNPRAATHADANGDGEVDSLDICPIAEHFDSDTGLAKTLMAEWISEASTFPEGIVDALLAALEYCPGEGPGHAALGGMLREIRTRHLVPEDYTLAQNYPNPFNPSTVISFSLPVRSMVTLSIYDVLGRRIMTLLDEEQPPGTHWVGWDGTDERGVSMATGIYFYRIATGRFSSTRKMLLLK
jgi:PKD repeat protein